MRDLELYNRPNKEQFLPSHRQFGSGGLHVLTAFGPATTIHPMNTELTQIETQIDQLLGLYNQGKLEIRELRARLTMLESDNRHLSEKLRATTIRIEALLGKLPEL